MRLPGRPLYLPLVIALSLLTTSACADLPSGDAGATNGSGKSVIPVRFTATPDSFSSLIYISKAKGYFEDNGIQPQIQVYQNGVQGLDSVLSGQADANISVDFAAMTRLGKGNLEVLSAVGTGVAGFHKFAVRDDIEQLTDLKGKRIGILPGANQSYMTTLILEKTGITEDQVKLVPLDGLLTLSAALLKGDIDAAWVYGPAFAAVKDKPHIRIIADNTAVFTTQPAIYLLASKKFSSSHPSGPEQVLRAFDAAAKFIHDDPDAAASLVAAEVHGDKNVILRDLKGNDWRLFMSDEQVGQLTKLQEYGQQSGSFSVPGKVTDFLNLDALRKLKPEAVQVSPS